MISVLFNFFLLLSKLECALVRTEHVEPLEFRIALKLINNLRDSCIAYGYSLVTLPRMDLYKPTSNLMLNQIMKNEYVAFWQHLRQHLDCSKYASWLCKRSKGTAVALGRSVSKTGQRRGIAEAILLKPLFKRNRLNNLYSECLLFKQDDTLECLKVVVKNNVHDPEEREMSLTALVFLDNAANVTASHLELLRSADHKALEFIRDWDRINTVQRIIYLSLLLHARHIIAHLVNNQEEADKMSMMETQLTRIIITEFPSNMIQEVKREQIVAGGTAECIEDKKHISRVVKEIRLLLVKQALKKDNHQTLFLDKDGVLYIGINESCNDHEYRRLVLDSIKHDVMNGKLNLPANPMHFKLEF